MGGGRRGDGRGRRGGEGVEGEEGGGEGLRQVMRLESMQWAPFLNEMETEVFAAHGVLHMA